MRAHCCSSALVLAWAMPVIAATTVFQWLFDARFGVVNWVLDKLGWHSMADYNWVGSQLSTFFVITVLIVWQSMPFVAINLYAATTTIPKELYEAGPDRRRRRLAELHLGHLPVS